MSSLNCWHNPPHGLETTPRFASLPRTYPPGDCRVVDCKALACTMALGTGQAFSCALLQGTGLFGLTLPATNSDIGMFADGSYSPVLCGSNLRLAYCHRRL